MTPRDPLRLREPAADPPAAADSPPAAVLPPSKPLASLFGTAATPILLARGPRSEPKPAGAPAPAPKGGAKPRTDRSRAIRGSL